jgi:hypothetical protein
MSIEITQTDDDGRWYLEARDDIDSGEYAKYDLDRPRLELWSSRSNLMVASNRFDCINTELMVNKLSTPAAIED